MVTVHLKSVSIKCKTWKILNKFNVSGDFVSLPIEERKKNWRR